MMRREIVLKSYAKINLYLDVLSKRNDGYHNIKTIMQNITLGDEMKICLYPADKNKVSIKVEGPKIPADNTIHKAALLFLDEIKDTFEVRVLVKKNIPLGSGLGGASSNAAATLVGLNSLMDKPFPPSFLSSLSPQIGSDVPFFLKGGTCMVEGRGEKVKKMPSLNGVVMVVKPAFSIPTFSAYQWLDKNKNFSRKSMDIIYRGIRNNNLSKIGAGLFNIFEEVVIGRYPQIDKIKKRLLSCGAEGALLSGTGSAVYGLFRNKHDIKIRNSFGDARIFTCKMVNKSVEILKII